MPIAWKTFGLASGIVLLATVGPILSPEADWSKVSGQLAGLVSTIAFLLYIKAIFKTDPATKTTPNRVTWFVWAIIGWLILASYHEVGANKTIWLPIVYAISPTIIFFLSIGRGEGGWTREDLTALAISLAGIGMWWISQSSVTGLICFLIADLAAAWPTVKKCYKAPSSEDRVAWLVTAIADIFHLLAVDRLEFGIIIHPLYMVIVTVVIIYPLWRSVLWPNPKSS